MSEIHPTPSSTPNFRTELAAQLEALVPEAIADGKVDVKKLKELLADDVADDSERFGLFWPGKKRAMRAAQEPTTATLRPDFKNSKDWDTTQIIQRIAQANIGTYIKPASGRASRAFNKELYATEEFEQFWETISQRTTYRVKAKRKKIIKKSVEAIRAQPRIEPLRIEVTRASVTIHRGGAKAVENAAPRTAEMRGSYELPDIITELQDATRLTRRTIVDILLQSGRLEEFITNPNDVIAMMKSQIQSVLARLILDGIQYEAIAGSVYELRELQKDGADEKEYFLDHLYAVTNKQKTDFDHVVFDASYDGPERRFAELLDSREDIKLFMKLPPKFKIDTPVGSYNPDWAIIKQEGGEDRIYMIRETKSTLDESKRRPSENAKIKAAQAHFAAIGVVDYGVSVPEAWGL